MVIRIIEILILWFAFCFLSFGVLGMSFLSMKKAASKPWRLKIDKNYSPIISILVPTYNEADVIRFKLENLNKIDYPKEHTQIIIVDSKSNDGTVDIVNDFMKQHPEVNIKLIIENERKGKSVALNLALKHCDGEVVIVSDADCFWLPDVLRNAIPFLSDPNVGAISGPKLLLNATQSWITKSEAAYLDSMNLMKLGESKLGMTLLFEGGFSAYKRAVLKSFDPYNTGSDDCGTIISLVENKSRPIFVSEAKFYTAFPKTWKGKMNMKMRRANQLVRVMWRYLKSLLAGRITMPKRIIFQNIFNYIFGPFMFLALLITTILWLLAFPYFALVFLIFLVPKARSYLVDVIQNYLVLLLSMFSVAFKKKFIIWNKPEDRALLEENMLRQHGLI